MRRHAPFEPIDPSTCVWGGVPDVINSANFFENRPKGFGAGRLRNMAFPTDFAGRPYNILTLWACVTGRPYIQVACRCGNREWCCEEQLPSVSLVTRPWPAGPAWFRPRRWRNEWVISVMMRNNKYRAGLVYTCWRHRRYNISYHVGARLSDCLRHKRVSLAPRLSVSVSCDLNSQICLSFVPRWIFWSLNTRDWSQYRSKINIDLTRRLLITHNTDHTLLVCYYRLHEISVYLWDQYKSYTKSISIHCWSVKLIVK